MALRTPDDDPSLNPGQQHSDNQFNAPKKTGSGSATNPDNSGPEDIKNAEENPNGDWQNNVSGNKPNPSKSKGRFSFAKKKGPLALIITIVFGGGIGLATLFSPGLLLVQMKEVMVNKFNSQLTSMDVRTTKMLTAKTTGGMLCKSLSVGCKYSSMSEKQISNFEKAGITVESDSKTVLGRTKPKSFKFNNKTITASEFESALSSNPEFRAAVKVGYNPKFAGFADSIWSKAANKLGISKVKANIDGVDDDARLKSVQEDTKIASDSDEKPPTVKEGETIDPNTNEPYTKNDAAHVNNAAEIVDDIADGAEDVAKKGVKAGTVLLESAEKVGNVLKITGHLDIACSAYGAVQAVGYAAKTVRALQLAKYAMIFLNVADQIKAGVAKPEDVSYLGTVLTTEVAATKTTNQVKAATDSFGYKFAAYGDRGEMTTTATQFLAGGGLTGKLIGVTGMINSSLGGSPKTTCRILKNPFVAGASLLVGIGLFLVPGVNLAIGAWDATKIAGTVAVTLALAYLPAMLKDIVAGVLVDKSTVGENAGDAITSGSSGIMSASAAAGGNAPLTPDQAVAYNNLSNTIAAQYAEEDRLAYSPFDITNSNTFMGSVVAKLIPYASKMSSLSGVFSSIASLATGSLTSTTSQITKAASTDDYTMCQDFDYRSLNLATDPYCNVMYGIPTEALDTDPIEVADAMSGQIYETDDATTGSKAGDPIPGKEYDTFLKDCINRERPLGDPGESQESDGSECLFDANSDNKNFYVFFIDQRVEKGMSGEDTVLAAAETSTQDRNVSFYDNNSVYSTTALNTGSNQ